MVDTYTSEQEKLYYVPESSFGVVPTSPALIGNSCSSLDPSLGANNIRVPGTGSVDLAANKRGLREPILHVKYPLPSDAPINLLQHVKQELNNSLSMQVLYYKGLFASATDILSLLYKGMRFNKATIECDIDGIIEADAEFVGQDVETGTAKIANATYTDYNGAVSGSETYFKVANVACERITHWKVQIENNCKPVPVIRAANAYIAKYVPWGKRLVSGEVKFEFESKQEAEDILADTEQSSLEFGLGGAYKINLPYTKWDDVSISGKAEDLIYASATFTSRGAPAIS
jgi:Phage tail tube protein